MDMSTNTSTQNECAVFGGMRNRRASGRFPLKEELKYRVLHSEEENPGGFGKTLNIGSGGILFSTDGRLAVGRMVELSVNWPARIDGTCALQFIAVGRVVRSESGQAVVKIERYEFKTRRASAAAAAGAGGPVPMLR